MYRLLLLPLLTAVLSLGCVADADPDPDPDGPGAIDDLLHAPVLVSATAQTSGRFGKDLRLEVSGSDLDGDAAGVSVRLLASSDTEAPLFDSDFDGLPDSGQTYLPFDVPVAATPDNFVAAITVLGLFDQGLEVSSFEIAIVDGAAQISAVIAGSVTAQPVKQVSESCDPSFVRDRCADDLGCKGAPSTCQPGEAPALVQMAYLAPVDAAFDGPRLLLAGTEPDDDMRFLHLEFMDAAGNPVFIDLNADDSPDASTLDVDASASSAGGLFFVEVQLIDGIQDLIQRIAAIPEDRGGRVGARQEALLTPIVVKGAGQICDVRGFDTCITNTACVTGANGTSTCQVESVARAQQCAVAEVLTLTAGHASYAGVAVGGSVWDAPPGCATDDQRGRPEAVVLLHLTEAASRVVITTDTPNTNFDTTLYVINPCTAAGDTAITCVDDDELTNRSTVEMQGVPIGTYAIVIDSYRAAGGAFGLEVTVE